MIRGHKTRRTWKYDMMTPEIGQMTSYIYIYIYIKKIHKDPHFLKTRSQEVEVRTFESYRSYN